MLLSRALLALLLAASLCACAPSQPAAERELLNSERIEQTFGSYDLDLLTSTPTLRVSNLHSTHDGRKICRTFAVAVFPQRPDAAIAAEHAEISAGGSIGSTFVAAGWRVVKKHRYVGQIDSTPKLDSLMGIEPSRLTVHVYTLGVSDGERDIDYATMIEIHHPAYLQIDRLREIYSIVNMSEADSATEQSLAVMAAQIR